MSNPLLMKLAAGAGLSENDRVTLDFLCRRSRQVTPRSDLITEGERPEYAHVVLDGFACRSKLMPSGGRQVLALLVPGDFCYPNEAILGPIDHTVGTLTPCKIVDIPLPIFENLTSRSPGIRYALNRASLVDHRVLRVWLTNVGQRKAEKRMAHLFCELLARLQAVGLADADGCAMPFRQPELGDILGITSVHVNRSLKELRNAGLATLKRRRLVVHDPDRLAAFCDFDPGYLHLPLHEPALRRWAS